MRSLLERLKKVSPATIVENQLRILGEVRAVDGELRAVRADLAAIERKISSHSEKFGTILLVGQTAGDFSPSKADLLPAHLRQSLDVRGPEPFATSVRFALPKSDARASVSLSVMEPVSPGAWVLCLGDAHIVEVLVGTRSQSVLHSVSLGSPVALIRDLVVPGYRIEVVVGRGSAESGT